MVHASSNGMGQMLAFPGGFGAARDPGVQALQAALKQLGTTVRDPLLARINADGILGPATVQLTNRAFTTHIGPGQAPAQFRTGALSAASIKAQASSLAQLARTEAARRATAAVTTGAGRLSPQQQAEINANPTARSGASHFSSGDPRDLQVALQQLGNAVRDGVLMRITADGKLGPATVAAVNRAFTTHIGPGQAHAQFRTGRLTLPMLQASLATITGLIRTEAIRRIDKAQNTGAGHFGPSPGAPVGPPLPPAQAARELQQALNYLAQQSRDNRLRVAVDGKIGPGTAKAVNIALTTHVGPGQAPAGLRTGTLSVATIVAGAAQIGTIIRTEAARRATGAVTTGPGSFGPGGGGAPVPMGPPLAPRAAAIMLQQGLAYLGREARDGRLSKIKADGKIGPATVAATNIAFSTHIGPYQAGGVSRLGNLTLPYVVANAQMLGTLVSREAARRHFGAGAPSTPAPGTTWVPGQTPGGMYVPSTGPVVSNRSANKILQTRLAQLGRVNRDGVLMGVKADGVVGPKTVAAVNRAFTAYITTAPGEFRTGSLSVRDVLANAQTMSEYVGQALQSQGTSPATAPPDAEVGPNAEGEGAAITPGADQPPPPPPPPGAEGGGAQADEGGGGGAPAYQPPSGGGAPAYQPPAEGGGAVTPTEASLGPDGGTQIPWVPIGIGVGLAAVTVIVILMSKKSSGTPAHAYKQPARKRAA